MSIRCFLAKAKQSLSQTLSSKGEHPATFVIGNGSADLDSITCALVYGYVRSNTQKPNKCIIPVTNIPSKELRLRPELTALLKHADLTTSDLVTLDDLGKVWETLPAASTDWTLVDHNVLQGALGNNYSGQVGGVIDHHEDEGNVPQNARPRIIEKAGSCNSLVVNYLRELWDLASSSASGSGTEDGMAYNSTWDAQVAQLALGSILIDTVNVKADDKVTEHDREAIKYLEGKVKASSRTGPSYDRGAFFKEINDAKSNLDDLSLEDILRKDYKQWTEGNLILGISSVVKPIEYLKTKAEDLVAELVNFAKSCRCDIYAVMTSHNDSGHFARQLLLMSVESGKPTDVVEKFFEKAGKQLRLKDSDTKLDEDIAASRRESVPSWLKLWEQQNFEASRKKVGPMLREAMRR